MILLPLLAVAFTISGDSLADYVQAMNWDAARKGPLMVLEPQTVTTKKDLQGLIAYGRTRTSLPGLTAIVPDTMVIIDDSMQQPPNMYDGLPRHSKVLYLMSTLNGAQWSAITGQGLGFQDLNASQRPVLESILPKPFKVATFTADQKGDPQPSAPAMALSDADRQGVRLHVDRSLEFMMPIVGQQGITPRNTTRDYGKPGSKVVERDSDADFRPQESFGVKIRQIVPNQQKPSDLDYHAPSLRGSIALHADETIAALLERIGAATGLELYADLRIKDRPMACFGRSVPVASALRAIALSVTGTYRKVGPCYILTSDLIGMGTRKMRMAEYDAQLNRKLWNQESLWKGQIYGSGHLNSVKFRGDDALTPTDSLLKKLDQLDRSSAAKVTASDLSEGLRQFVDRQNRMYRTQQVTAEGATVTSSFDYSFVLPNGDQTRPEFDSLGSIEAFHGANGNRQGTPELPNTPKLDAAKSDTPIYLVDTANTIEEAQAVVGLAANHGIKELWLDTLSPEALKVAIKIGEGASVHIALAVRPFNYRGPTDDRDADRTLFLDTPPESLKRRMAAPDWDTYQKDATRPPEELGPISPLSSSFRTRVQTVIEMAKSAGLTGVRIMGSTPHGYNGPRVKYLSFPSPLFMEEGNFGYAAELRVGFIRLSSVDPIDLCPRNVYTNSDLRQPFFLDDALRGSTSVYDGTDNPNPAMEGILDAYATWLAKLNRDGLKSLLGGITRSAPQLPILMDAITTGTNSNVRYGVGLIAWKPGEPLPEIPEGQRGGIPDYAKYIAHMTVADDDKDPTRLILSYMAHRNAKGSVIPGVAIDLTQLKLPQAERWLNETFTGR
ncbi:MAG: hypothetical protein P4L46_25355 [Fimbriimonas sp.]|nr:hypothetical protein [Fimbriimonas sp.]